MEPDRKLELVFLWHMHQPDYRDHATGEFRRPWTYLHALKDYTDMAGHLERNPPVHAVVNFVPVLLDQIEDYAQQFETGDYRDPLLRLLARDSLDRMDPGERRLVLATCFPDNHVRMVAPYPRFERLRNLYRQLEGQGEAAAAYLSGTFFTDLLVWYHLVWTGETERRSQPLLAELMTKGEGFTLAERRQLLALMGQTMRGLIPRYRALAERGQIELSATPDTHPLAPLLLDFASAREAQPDIPLPKAHFYPGGRSRIDRHIGLARESHARRFGRPPEGMWPAEGALSVPLLSQLAAQGCRWTASSQGVLANSLRLSHIEPATSLLYHPWRIEAAPGIAVFFRDEKLSDLIGFEYAKWHGRDAAQHFVDQLARIRDEAPAGETPLVCVILDGENAWEHYPYNAYFFFEDLYGLIASQPWLATTTCTEWLARNPERCGKLPALVAGSWVYGTFSTWIGDPDKNRAWDLLCDAKQAYDLVMDSGRLDADARRAAEAQLAVCEGSDWFWWFGDYNPREAVESFDALFRANLAHLYRLLRLNEPPQLAAPLSRGGGTPEGGGAMRRAS
ncbi:MAG: glycoside hydrolase [Betaproteobacteria bacterium HGW-Betaproteobacteria-14]|nr:MAG: glycoside hydrolase [Betaproteobacteria bacterium HGW-Betaproteobacteria-14]